MFPLSSESVDYRVQIHHDPLTRLPIKWIKSLWKNLYDNVMFSNVCCFIIYVCLNFQRRTRMKLRWKINILTYRLHTLTYLLACCSKEYHRMLIVIKQTFQIIIEFK